MSQMLNWFGRGNAADNLAKVRPCSPPHTESPLYCLYFLRDWTFLLISLFTPKPPPYSAGSAIPATVLPMPVQGKLQL